MPGEQRKRRKRNTRCKEHGENIYRKGLKYFQIDRVDAIKKRNGKF